MALLSIMGLYNYDNTLFSQMALPVGVDLEILTNKIILDNAELEVLYPDPATMKQAINIWSLAQLPNWTRLKKAIDLEYDPITNYDRTETETVTRTGTDDNTRQHSGNDTQTETESNTTQHSGTDTNSITRGETITRNIDQDITENNTNTGTELNEIAAFDSTTLATHDKKTINGSQTNTTNTLGEEVTTSSGTEAAQNTHGEKIEDTSSRSNQFTHGEKIEDSRETEENVSRSVRAYGNIGVTTSQQMLESELELIPKLNIYDAISKEFTCRFCILVY